MNVYDSQKMMDLLQANYGARLTDKEDDADLLILNTCSIREKPQEKVFHELGRWRKRKAKNPKLLVGVTGCVASQEGEAIIKREPLVDFVLGPQTIHKLPEMIDKIGYTKKPQVDTSFTAIEKFDNLPPAQQVNSSAFVSIMEGCNKFCSFCIVPYTRGEEISRPFKDVIKEVYALAEKGVREINLLGQNVNDYYGQLDNSVGDLALLIHYIAAIDGIERIRFTTSHPAAFTDQLVRAFAEEEKLVPFLHFPVQSGSDRILQAMKRGYTVERYLERIEAVRKARPDTRFSTDIIVGFPGESEEDFQGTLDLVDEVKFDTSFSFIYSKRPGTPAASLHDETPLEIKKQRLSVLQQKLLGYASEYSRAFKDKTVPVLIEGLDKRENRLLAGRTVCNRVVLFQGDPSYIGQIVNVQISQIFPNSLRGRMVGVVCPSQDEVYV